MAFPIIKLPCEQGRKRVATYSEGSCWRKVELGANHLKGQLRNLVRVLQIALWSVGRKAGTFAKGLHVTRHFSPPNMTIHRVLQHQLILHPSTVHFRVVAPVQTPVDEYHGLGLEDRS